MRRFFSPNGTFRHTILIIDDRADTAEESKGGVERTYDIAYPALARYFHTHFDSGVKTMQLVMEKGTTDQSLPGDCHIVENKRASLVYWFEGGSHVSLVLFRPVACKLTTRI